MTIEQCRIILQEACDECESKWIALSGGLDSSIIAELTRKQEMQAMTIITKDFVGTDLTYAQIMAKHGKTPLSLMHIDCLLYTSPSPRDGLLSRMPSAA
mgnify:CR=1 FL=1